MRRLLLRLSGLAGASLGVGLLVQVFHPFGIRREDLFLPGSSPRISLEAAFFQLGDPQTLFLDVRPDIEYRIDHIPQAVSFYPPQAVRRIRPAKTEGITWVVYDFRGGREAQRVAWALQRMGARRVYLLEGGFAGWLDRGLPVSEGGAR